MKRALFIGRWQPLHPGHQWLFNQKLEKGVPILIAVRDTPIDDSNPFTTEDVIANKENPRIIAKWEKDDEDNYSIPEFEKMMGDKMGDDDDKEESLEPTPEVAPEVQPMEAKADEGKMKKEKMDEYKIQKSANNSDMSDKSAKSPVKTGGAKQGGTPVKTGSGAEEKGRPAPTAQKMGEFENSPGKAKGTSMKKEVKPATADGSDKSAKSPVVSRK